MNSKRLLLRASFPVFLLFISFSLFAQTKQVSGKVKDSRGQGVIGASVVVKNTQTGTTTDAEGNFSFSAPESATTLTISAVGFTSKDVSITAGTMDISMSEATVDLNEVVVVGYGTARRGDITGAVASVKAKDFNQGIQTSPDQLIQGKVAGVQILNNSGQPGGGTTVKIRGNSAIRAGANPLFVVDGIPLDGRSARPGGSGQGIGTSPAANPLNFMNPNDIESIEVLKDASATAIYGSRAAYGVVLINTKRGKTGEPSLNVNGYVGMSKLIKQLEVLDADEYRQALDDYGLAAGDFGGDVDAMDAILRTAYTQNYNMGVSGGTENGRYRLSVGYLDQQGIVRKSDFKKLTTSLNGGWKFLESRRLGVDYNIIAAQTTETIAPVSNDAGFTGSIIGQALQWNPTRPLIVKRTNGTDSLNILRGSTTINPLAMSDAYDDNSKVTSIVGSIAPWFKITDYLEYKLLFSINYSTGIRKAQIASFINLENIIDRGVAYVGTNELLTKQLTHTLNFNKKLNPDLNLNAVIGYEYLEFDYRGTDLLARDFGGYTIPYTNFLQYSTQNTRNLGSFADPTTELQSYFARAIFNYKEKYALTATFRADGSSKFGANNRYGYFPSFSAAWFIGREDFMSNINWINEMKIRAGWGKTGSQDAPAGSAQNRYVFTGPGAITQANNENPDLKWQSDQQLNLGVDFTLFDNRLSGTIDYFHKKTGDLLFPVISAQPVAPGAPPQWQNLDAEVINKGVEITLFSSIIKKRDLVWDLGLNLSFIQNSVEGLAAPIATGALHGQGISGATVQRIANGQPINTFYTKQFLGINKTTGIADYAEEGYQLFYLGNPNPKTIIGISTALTFKKWYLNLNFNGALGQDIYNNTANTVLPIGNLIGGRNIAKALIEGDAQESLANPISPSTRYMEDGSYIKLANATIQYNLGSIGKTFKNVFVYVAGQNLLVFTKFTGFDPEVNTDKQVNGVPSVGIEYTPYPSARSFQFGLNFNL
jgi:TonB-dependent starch-binding outer membrane protein SusC